MIKVVKKSGVKVSSQPSTFLSFFLCVAYGLPVSMATWRQSEIKGTGSRETGHICFDVFTLHKRRRQPLSVSTHDALGHLSASGHFALPFSLSRIVTVFKKRQTSQTRMRPLHFSMPSIQDQILRALWCHALFCFVFVPLEIWNSPVSLKDVRDRSSLWQLQLESVSRISLWYR